MNDMSMELIYHDCPECHGTGETPNGHTTLIGAPCYGMCKTCEGTGYTMEFADEVSVPAELVQDAA